MTAALADKLQARIRPVAKDDWAFILDSWKKSYHESHKDIPAHIYYANQHTDIEQIRQRGAEFRIAHDPDDSDFIWGWACVEGGVLHYVFVRSSARGQGVARLLLADLPQPIACSHWTKFVEPIARKRPGVFLYEPSRRRG